MRNSHAQRGFYLGLVHHRVQRAGGFGGVLGGADGGEPGRNSAQLKNSGREIIPRSQTLVAVVVEAEGLGLGFDEVQDGAGQVDGVGGRARLVPDDAQLGALAAQLAHGFHEVAGKFGV